jgi:hypothetical protein
MNHALDLLNELFLSTELWGLLGPLAIVLFGAKLTKEDKNLGVMWYIVILFMTLFTYLPDIVTYTVHTFIMLGGGALTCIVPQLSR